jgi:hypothetical protein
MLSLQSIFYSLLDSLLAAIRMSPSSDDDA